MPSSTSSSERGAALRRAPDKQAAKRFLLSAAAFLVLLFTLDRTVAAALHRGLERYHGLDRRAPILCVGHSRTLLGIDATALSQALGLDVARYALNGAGTQERDVMIRQAVARNPALRVLVYDVEAATFTNRRLSTGAYRLLLPFTDDSDAVAACVRGRATWLENACHRLLHTTRYNEVTAWLAIRGLSGRVDGGKHGTFNIQRAHRRIEQGLTRPVEVVPACRKAFLKTLAFARSHQLEIVLLHMPTVDLLNRTQAAAREEVRTVFRQLAAADAHVHFIDFSRRYETRYDLFYDAIHLNTEGRRVMTKDLAKELASILAPLRRGGREK